jgi:uncharacterized protein (UPF0332 family)
VTPQATRFLEKAEKMLARADTMLGASLNEDAGRTAYLAAFHAVQALIFERLGRVLKTHKGIQTEFLRLTKDDRRFDPSLRNFLRQAYNLKAIADYETGPGADISADRAVAAVAAGKQFVAHVTELITAPGSGPTQGSEQPP